MSTDSTATDTTATDTPPATTSDPAADALAQFETDWQAANDAVNAAKTADDAARAADEDRAAKLAKMQDSAAKAVLAIQTKATSLTGT